MVARGNCNYTPSINQRVRYKVGRVRVRKLHGSIRAGWIRTHAQKLLRFVDLQNMQQKTSVPKSSKLKTLATIVDPWKRSATCLDVELVRVGQQYR